MGALIDTGAATSLISWGLCKAIGLPIDSLTGGLSYKAADGSVFNFVGVFKTPVLTLHPQFEVTVACLLVTDSD